ncbi:TPA: hypothetical protein ACH3X1_015148 [Trebouxia sp. C0004]
MSHAVIGGAHPGCLYQTQRPLERIQSSRHGLVGHCHGLLRGRPNGCKTKLASTHARCQVFANTYAASDMLAVQLYRQDQFFWLAEIQWLCSPQEPSLDAVGALADLLVFTFNLTGLDILQKIEAQDTSWWQYRLLFRDLHHADKKQDHNSLAKPLQSILHEVEGHPVVKTKVLHLFRDSGVILLASSLGQAYIEKNPLAALQAFAIAGGREQTSFMKRHFLGRALVAVPDEWIDRLLPDVRRVNELLKARNSRLQTGGKRQAHDKVSDRAAEGFLQTTLYTGVAFLAEFAISYTEVQHSHLCLSRLTIKSV